MRIAGVQDHGGKPIDGIDILEILTGRQPVLERELYNYIGQAGPETEQIYHTTNECKLLILGPQVNDDSLDDSKPQRLLFKLKEDPWETINLAGEYPERVQEMYAKLRAVRDLMPEVSVPPFLQARETENPKPPKEWKLPED
jgi:hypothetical protein